MRIIASDPARVDINGKRKPPSIGIIHRLHTRMVMILVVIFFCIAGTMYVFVKNFVDPLEGNISTSRKIAEEIGEILDSFDFFHSTPHGDQGAELAR